MPKCNGGIMGRRFLLEKVEVREEKFFLALAGAGEYVWSRITNKCAKYTNKILQSVGASPLPGCPKEKKKEKKKDNWGNWGNSGNSGNWGNWGSSG